MLVKLLYSWLLLLSFAHDSSAAFEQDLAYVDMQTASQAYDFEMMDILGLRDRPSRGKRELSLRNSASKFLLEIYNEIIEDTEREQEHFSRSKRALEDENFITAADRLEIENSNNIITFSSKGPRGGREPPDRAGASVIELVFNTNDVPNDLKLVHAALRLYQHSPPIHNRHQPERNVTVSIYEDFFNRRKQLSDCLIVASINTTTAYSGWLELNITRLLAKWLQHRSTYQPTHGHVVLMKVTDLENDSLQDAELSAESIGIVAARHMETRLDLLPFIVGYFNGPELMAKIHKLRFKREIVKRKRKAPFHMAAPQSSQEIYRLPKTCERLNFTLDFRDLHMQNWVIAPRKFEAYFCGGECNFPLASRMNATNHAIVQTLMHLKQPNLPKPCCVPTALGSISILHYLNDDSVNLSKYPQSVAKECGCH